jgi:hypothetical protein
LLRRIAMRIVAVWLPQAQCPRVFENCFATVLGHRLLIFDSEGGKAAEYEVNQISRWAQSQPLTELDLEKTGKLRPPMLMDAA